MHNHCDGHWYPQCCNPLGSLGRRGWERPGLESEEWLVNWPPKLGKAGEHFDANLNSQKETSLPWDQALGVGLRANHLLLGVSALMCAPGLSRSPCSASHPAEMPTTVAGPASNLPPTPVPHWAIPFNRRLMDADRWKVLLVLIEGVLVTAVDNYMTGQNCPWQSPGPKVHFSVATMPVGTRHSARTEGSESEALLSWDIDHKATTVLWSETQTRANLPFQITLHF